jgi:hypothetical protein
MFIVITNISTFPKSPWALSLTNLVFLVIYGLTGIREKLTKRGEDRKTGGGYTRLPQ